MTLTGMEIAVVGMACHFPKSRNIWEFWQHLESGDELVTHFTEEELNTFGVDPKMRKDVGYVGAEAVIDNPGHFDAAFFKIAESDARLMDPQQRLLLECAWHALEDGGYSPEEESMNCGVFVSGGNNKYYLQNVLSNPDKVEEVGEFQIEIGNSVNFLATRISYLFNLTGPASVVQTACSSSLVAIHYACQSLLNGECDMALSGGSKVEVPQNYGHVHTEGGVKSKEGHCRVFDKDASGFVNGNGCGIVLLKRLEDAQADGDQIYGMIKGSALNNDGSEKIGYTAPSISGQKQVIEEALDIAEVSPESIAYIEAHGTGTKLGDPIEIDGLKQIFTSTDHHCALGSVKANMGHLDAAAGVAGFIKAMLVLYHRKICPQINFNHLNPAIQLGGSPFYIPTSLTPWSKEEQPFRAGVSSFGIGGTNAHLILEEAPIPLQKEKARLSTPFQIITSSAKTEQSVFQYQRSLVGFVENGITIEDLSFSNWHKRPQFPYRSAVVAKSGNDLQEKLQDPVEATLAVDQPKVFFLFPGQGSQYVNMTRELYQQNATYKKHLGHCLDTLRELSGMDFKAILFSEAEQDRIHETQYAQPLVFSVEYALTKVLAEFSVVPDAMIGHSLGEITAACIAGTLSLRNSLELVLTRSRLMQSMPRGAMVSVSLNGQRQFLESLPESLCIAAINSESNYVISGEIPGIDKLEEELTGLKIKHRRLKTSHAYHSHMMQGMLAEFESNLNTFSFEEPKIPFVSNLSGAWVQPSEISAGYWRRHVENPVQFLNGIRLLDEEQAVFIEVGPGSALSYLTTQTLPDRRVVNLIPSNTQEPEPIRYLYEGLSKLWEHGVSIDLGQLVDPEARKVRLPGYAFDHKDFWLPPGKSKSYATAQKPEDLTYAPYWKSILLEGTNQLIDKNCLILATPFLSPFIKELKSICKNLVVVTPGKRFKGSKLRYEIVLNDPSQYDLLLDTLKTEGLFPQHIIHGLSVTSKVLDITVHQADMALGDWYYSLLDLIRALGSYLKNEVSLDVLTNDSFSVLGGELTTPLKASLAGPVKIAPLEYEGLNARLIEFHSEDWKKDKKAVFAHLISFLKSTHRPDMKMAALRGQTFWEQDYRPVKPVSKGITFRKNGVYLITGGFGGMGSTISKYLAEQFQARIALFTSSAIPPEDQWQKPLNERDQRKVDLMQTIVQLGGEAKAYAIDIADLQPMEAAIKDLLQEWGEINGIIHTAGKADFGGILAKRNNESIREILAPKIHGHQILKSLTRHLPLDFFINFSSIGNQVYGKKFGQVAYNTANEYLDACASAHSNEKTISWCDWLEVGMAFDAVKKKNNLQDPKQINAKVLHGISPQAGVELFQKVVSSSLGHTLISPIDLPDFISSSNTAEAIQNDPNEADTGFSQTELTQKLTKLYESFFGIQNLDTTIDFSELGGDSLKAVVLLSRIKKKLQVPLTLNEFYDNSSVAALSSLLSAESTEEIAPVETENFLLPSGKHVLFGTWYISSAIRHKPIIICPPVLQEEIIADRALNTLSDRLASLQAPVLRFDFAGMGNSEGDELQLSLESWLQNLQDLIACARDRFLCKSVHLVGLRMGASLIDMFAKQIKDSTDQLLLWHPVIDGSKYLNDLNKYQKLFINGSFGDPTGLNNGSGVMEFNGYQVSESLQKSIKDLRLDLSNHASDSTLILSENQLDGTSHAKTQNLIVSKSPPFWNKLATEKGYIPESDIEEIVQWHQNLIS